MPDLREEPEASSPMSTPPSGHRFPHEKMARRIHTMMSLDRSQKISLGDQGHGIFISSSFQRNTKC